MKNSRRNLNNANAKAKRTKPDQSKYEAKGGAYRYDQSIRPDYSHRRVRGF